MASCDDIIGFCDQLLDIESFEDFGPNGLQVPGAEEVSAVATGVTANLEFLQRAIDSGAQLIMTHHGLLWRGEAGEPMSPLMAGRLRAVLCAGVSVAAYHLPLDAHPVHGNNALLRDALGLEADPRPFAEAKGSSIGLIGRFAEPVGVVELESRLRNTTGSEPLVFDSGPEQIREVGVITGAGAFALDEAGELGLDAVVTGEPSEEVMGEAAEHGIHFLAAGHYDTETSGIQRLGDLVAERFGVAHRFIDVPNPV